jgi:squalene-hopene/tetraprenyl-beta-curcumene cyclase
MKQGTSRPQSAPLPHRRDLLRWAAATAAGLAGCRRNAPEGNLLARIDDACRAAASALVKAQSADGSWRSPTYGVFRDGLTLTPTVLKAVAFGPDVPGAEEARRRGAAYLASRVRDDSSIDDGPTGLVYPVYTAAASAIALTRVGIPGGTRARDAWLAEVRRRQLVEGLSWSPDDPPYGGWGYATTPSSAGLCRAPDADLSSTLFALGALGVANTGTDGPAIAKALRFVERCQNFAGPDGGDPPFDDGGFFFSPVDPVRNKAGASGTDRRGRPRYHSYGSATADGLRALLRCGLGMDHPRVAAARAWLVRRFEAATNPGTFEPIREPEREATYFYYAWSLAHAARALATPVPWPEPLARELLRRQRPDGTWINRFTASKEDDPLVATSLAAGALGLCRLALTPR